MQSSPAAVATLRTLLTAQRLAVVATQQNGHPYTSLVAFVFGLHPWFIFLGLRIAVTWVGSTRNSMGGLSFSARARCAS